MSTETIDKFLLTGIDGVSEESYSLASFLNVVRESLSNSVTLSRLRALRDELFEAANENIRSNEKQSILTDTTLQFAELFIDNLPNEISLPEVSVDGDDISFDWIVSRERIFSVSINENNLIYALVLGSRRKKGKEDFYGEIPSDVREVLLQSFHD